MLCGELEIKRAHCTPTEPPRVIEGKRRPRPIHVAFLHYSDKMKVVLHAAARLKVVAANQNNFFY